MFSNAQNDNCPPRQDRNHSFSVYHSQRAIEAAPTREEYDRVHNFVGGPQGWTALDIEPRWHNEEELNSTPCGPDPVPYMESIEDYYEEVAGSGSRSRTVASLAELGESDPFNNAIDRLACVNEPLRGDRRSLDWERAMQRKRMEIAASLSDNTTCLESNGMETQADIDETGLNMRTALASLGPLEVDPIRFRPRCDREEHQNQTRLQFEASANSQLSRGSYGNFGM